jgi:hypothetical protein
MQPQIARAASSPRKMASGLTRGQNKVEHCTYSSWTAASNFVVLLVFSCANERDRENLRFHTSEIEWTDLLLNQIM